MSAVELSQLDTFEKIKKRAQSENTISIMKICEEESIKLAKNGMSAEDIASSMPQYAQKKSSLYRKRWQNYPKLPCELGGLIIDTDIYKNTLTNGKRFLLIDCIENNQRIIIFCSDFQLNILGSSTRIGADDTFKSCPSLFMQLYILMAWYKGEVIPCCFVWLGGKNKTTYSENSIFR